MDGVYEHETLDFVAVLIDGKVFFDVGANIGSYALSLHRKAKKIYAFEASKTNINYLEDNIRANGIDNIKTINKAISSEDNRNIKIYLSPDAGGNHSIYDKFDGKYENIKTITLDSFYHRNNIEEIDIIKIDVEGAEFDVIKGANQTLNKFKPLLIIEFCSTNASAAGFQLSDLYFHLKNLGYESYMIKNRMLCEIKLDAFDLDSEFQQNIIFVHKDKTLMMPPSSFLLHKR
jgi:FkbM family methyltransferase